MFKKILLTAMLFTGIAGIAAAQDFTMTADTMSRDTSGSVAITPCGEHSVIFYNYLNNNTGTTIPAYHWQIIVRNFPTGWYLCQLCDNNICRDSSAVANNFVDVQAGQIGTTPATRGQLEPAIMVPSTAANGVGVLRVEVWTDNTRDTATFIVNKTPTGISKIAVDDKRVNVYPNPANNTVLIYAEKSLNAANISIVSITGQTVYNKAFNANKEAENISISSLAKGTYMIRLTDDKGQLVTSRKFIKE